MPTATLNLALAFLEGLGLILSPCILPILPIILSGAIVGNKKRPFGIILGFILSFALFTFFSRELVRYSGIDLTIVRDVSFVLLILFGIVMLSEYLSEKLARALSPLANTGSAVKAFDNNQAGFFSGVLFGCLVGLVWTPCAGPILAAVIVQSVMQKTTVSSFLTIVFFAIGAAIPMLLIALLGKKIMDKFQFLKVHGEIIRKILGAIIIVTVLLMIWGESFSANFSLFASKQNSASAETNLVDSLLSPYSAPPLEGIVGWINSPPLDIKKLKGKVVLVDFWAYSCINCVRTLPYLKDWYAKYHDQGFEIIGVHSPEFDFESIPQNVEYAVKKYGIKYPVALDNQFATWRSYHNEYWPAHYLIDRDNNVVYQHFGEGEYDTTENNIRYLLGMKTTTTAAIPENKEFLTSQTPETYLGFARASSYANAETIIKNHPAQYAFPDVVPLNGWALKGPWIIGAEKVVAVLKDSAIKIHFHARKVFVVMGNGNQQSIKVNLLLNGKKVIHEKGKDVVDSSINVSRHNLYEAVVLPQADDGVLELTTTAPGLEVYTFTFGN